MNTFKALLTLSVVGLAHSQDGVFNAYSPGAYSAAPVGGVYKATPRLVPVKSGQPLLGAGGGQVIKRVRVQPIPYASPALEHPVQFTHTVPAVASYKPQQQIAYAPQQPQPAYYGHSQPQVVQQRPKLVKQVQAVPTRSLRPNIPDTEEQQEAEEYASDPNPQYNFAFDVKDDDLTNYQNRQEQRDNGVVKGSYSVVDPDGYVRTVTYEASPKGGFQAKVTREPTDVKIKFPVPTEAPEEVKGVARGQPAYVPQQYQQQPQYQPQQQYAAQPAYAGAGRFPQQGHRLAPRYQQ